MKKNIILRALYDFANSLVMIIFLFYFSQRLVIDQGVAEIWYNVSLIAASGIFILISPYLSKLVDQGANKIHWLRFRTIVAVILFAIVWSMTLWTPEYTIFITILYAVAMGCYLLCFVYYTPMLNDLATHENHAQVSGRGQGVNSFGQVMWLLVSIPIINGAIPFLDASRAGTLLPAAALFLVFSLPMLLRYNAPVRKIDMSIKVHNIRLSMKALFGYGSIVTFLIWYFLYSDALLTFANNYPLYLEKVHAVADTSKSLLTALILLGASISAFCTGKLADRIGLKKSLMRLLGARCVVFPIFAFIKWFAALAVMSVLAGLIYGPTRSVSRALFSRIVPAHLTARWFSYFTIAERFATFIWPLIRWSIVTWLGGEILGYKRALISMSILVFVGRWVSRKIENV
jgi:UMF1 family MFS transporter